MIANWTIVQTLPFGIRLEGTTAHVRIEDVLILDAEASSTFPTGAVIGGGIDIARGIDVFESSNVTVRRARIPYEGWAVRVRESSDVTIEDVHVGRLANQTTVNSASGFAIANSRSIQLRRVSALDMDLPLYLSRVDLVLIEDSRFRGGSEEHTMPFAASNATIRRTLFERSEILASLRVHNVRFEENQFRGGRASFRPAYIAETDLREIVFCGNTFEGSSAVFGAIEIGKSSGTRIIANTFIGNVDGARINVDGAVVQGNLFRANQGVGLASTRAIEAHGNRFEGNAAGEVFFAWPGGVAANASFNWWGHPDGPTFGGTVAGDPVRMAASAVVSPWLTSPPPEPQGCPE